MCMLSLVNHFDSMSVPYIIGFGSEKLVPAFIHSFILSLVELRHYGHHPDFVGPVFNGQGRVGSHTDIYILEESWLRCFSWSHTGCCPFSQPLPKTVQYIYLGSIPISIQIALESPIPAGAVVIIRLQ